MAAAAAAAKPEPEKKGKKGKKGKAQPKRKSVKAKAEEERKARAEEERREAEKKAREEITAKARGSRLAVDDAWGKADKHRVSILYLAQERTAEFEVSKTTTLGELFEKMSAEFGAPAKTLRLVVHSPRDGSFRQIDGLDTVFHPKTLPELSILPTDTLHVMNAIFVIPEGAPTSTKTVVDKVQADVYWGYPPGCWRDYLDASCIAFSRDGKKIGLVDWRYRKDPAVPFLTHSGNLMNDAARQGHDKIDVDLRAVGPEVSTLFFTASAWTADHVSVLKDPSVSIVDASNTELCPPHVKEFGTKFRCLVLLALTRSTAEGAWDVIALGKGSDGNTRDYNPIIKTLTESCLPIVTAARHTVEEAAPKP